MPATVRTVLLPLLALALASCHGGHAPAGPARPAPRPAVQTGDPLPASPVDDPACEDEGGARWLASDPHVPFAVVGEGGIRPAGQACCAPWARAGTRWLAIGPRGEITGHAVLTGGCGYDVTQCYELSFDLDDGVAGSGLLVSADSHYEAEPVGTWAPAPDERAALAGFVIDLERLLLDPPSADLPDPPLPPLNERAVYFTVPDREDEGAPHRLVVVGGRLLVIAHLDEQGRWVASFLDRDSATRFGPREAYRVLSVLDLDGDGDPEVVYRWNDGPSWADVILDSDGDLWRPAAQSIGGSTA